MVTKLEQYAAYQLNESYFKCTVITFFLYGSIKKASRNMNILVKRSYIFEFTFRTFGPLQDDC